MANRHGFLHVLRWGDSVSKEKEIRGRKHLEHGRHVLGIPIMDTERTQGPEDGRRRNYCIRKPREREPGTQPGVCLAGGS